MTECLLSLPFTHIFLLGFVVDSTVVGFTLAGGEVGLVEAIDGTIAIVCCGCAACVGEGAIAVTTTTVDDVVDASAGAARLWPAASVNRTTVHRH